ncbi:MAG: hypothetical protein AAB631_00680 [Patescibacteria group bacterium]
MHQRKKQRGFTIAEITIGVMVFVVVAVIGITMLNPAGQLARGRNSQRNSHINTLMNVVRQNISDNRSGFSCSAGSIPTTTVRMATAGATTTYDIGPCLVPVYLQKMPFDPSASGAHYGGTTDYDSAYYIIRNASSGVITISAPFAEAGKVISITR